MFFAINSKTGERVNSLTIESNPSYQFINEEVWYADSDEIELCPKELDITKIEVRFREGATDVINWNGTKFDISPCFFIPNKSKLGINTIPESREHKLAKNWIYNKLKQKDLFLAYSSISKPYHYTNKINLCDLPLDLIKIGIEVNSSTSLNRIYRRADIICPFLTKHDILGNGIVFEIQFSKQKERTKVLRELDWAIRGYSIAWLHESDFDKITEEIISLKKQEVNVESFAFLIKQNKKEQIRDMKFTIEELCRQLDNKRDEVKTDVAENFGGFMKAIREEKVKQLQFDINDLKQMIKQEFEYLKGSIQPRCPICNKLLLVRMNRTNGNKFWACMEYGHCTMPYEEY